MNISKQDFSLRLGDDGQEKTDTNSEDIRLAEELRYKPVGNKMGFDSLLKPAMIWDKGRLWGFDVETADYSKMVSYFTDARVTKRNPSSISFVMRKIAVRFDALFTQDKVKLSSVSGLPLNELELIESNATNDTAFTGSAGMQNMVMYNGSLDNPNVRTEKLRNGTIRSKRK